MITLKDIAKLCFGWVKLRVFEIDQTGNEKLLFYGDAYDVIYHFESENYIVSRINAKLFPPELHIYAKEYNK